MCAVIGKFGGIDLVLAVGVVRCAGPFGLVGNGLSVSIDPPHKAEPFAGFGGEGQAVPFSCNQASVAGGGAGERPGRIGAHMDVDVRRGNLQNGHGAQRDGGIPVVIQIQTDIVVVFPLSGQVHRQAVAVLHPGGALPPLGQCSGVAGKIVQRHRFGLTVRVQAGHHQFQVGEIHGVHGLVGDGDVAVDLVARVGQVHLHGQRRDLVDVQRGQVEPVLPDGAAVGLPGYAGL